MFGVLFNLLTKAVEGREQQKGTAEVLGEKKKVVVITTGGTYPNAVRSNIIHDKNPGEHVKATLCLVIYQTIFDSDGNMSRRPFIWLFITRFLIRIGTCQGDPCLVIYYTIFDSDGNVSRRPFVWLQVRHGHFSNCALLRTWKN